MSSIMRFLSAKLFLLGKNIPSSVLSFNPNISSTLGFSISLRITFYFEIIVIALFSIFATQIGISEIFFVYFLSSCTFLSISSWFSNFIMRTTVDYNKFLIVFLTATRSLCLTPMQLTFSSLLSSSTTTPRS